MPRLSAVGVFTIQGGRMSMREMVVDGVTHQFSIVVQAHLFQDSAAVGTYGLHAQRQGVGDLGNGPGRCEQQEYLVFPIRE